MSLEPGSSAWQTDTLPIKPNPSGQKLNLVVYKMNAKFKNLFLKTDWPFGTNILRVEYVTGVRGFSHEFSIASEFPMSCRLLVKVFLLRYFLDETRP